MPRSSLLAPLPCPGTCSWVPAHDGSLSAFGRLVTMAYPMMDIGVLFIVVNSLVFGGVRRPADKLVAVAVMAMVVADFVFDVQILHGSYTWGDPIDAGWLINYVLLGVAALHPSMATVLPPAPAAADQLHRRRWMPVVALAGFVSPGILLLGTELHVAVDVKVLAATSILLIALVVLRVSWLLTRLVRQTGQLQERTHSLQAALTARELLEADLRYQAFHDSLTGPAARPGRSRTHGHDPRLRACSAHLLRTWTVSRRSTTAWDTNTVTTC
jgi:diguanylate cyclase